MSSQGAIASIHASSEAKCEHQLQQMHKACDEVNVTMMNSPCPAKRQHRKTLDEIQDEIDALKKMYHKRYLNNPNFFSFQAQSGVTSVGSASSQNQRTEKLPKDIPHLNTPSARDPDPAAKKVEFNTAEEWADKVERVMNYNGLHTAVHMNNF